MILVFLMATQMAGAQPDRSRPPAPEPVKPLVLPAVNKLTLNNGLEVWVVSRPEVPVVQMNLIFPAGDIQDPPGRFGLAGFTSALLDEGAGGLSSLELADEIDFLGASLSAGTSYDYGYVSLYCTTDKLRPALEVMSKVVSQPDFAPAEIERLREQLLTALLQARDEPRSLMSRAFAAELYPAEHRYSSPGLGEKELRSFTREEIQAFHRAHYGPRSAHMLVVGDVDPKSLRGTLESAFEGWTGPETSPSAPTFPEVKQVDQRRVVLVDKPGSAQTVIRIGRIGAPRDTEDYLEIQVLNTILGGSFTSRLNQNLREEHGYTYGAFSYFNTGLVPGPFGAGADVQTDKTGAALEEFFKELERIREPIPTAELTRAKNYLSYTLPSELETNSQFADALEGMVVYGLAEDFLSTYVGRVQAITAEQVHQAALRYIDPEKVVVVLVGDRKLVEPQLKSLNLGPIEYLDAEQLF